MIQILSVIDSFLLSKFQKCSDFFQDWAGYTCFTLSRAALVLAASGFMLTICGMMFIPQQQTLLACIHAFIGTRIVLGGWRMTRDVEKVHFQNIEKSESLFRNFAQESLSSVRPLIAIIMLLTLLVKVHHTIVPHIHGPLLPSSFFLGLEIDILGIFLSIYFVSCTPKPKKPSRVRQMRDRFVAWLQPSPGFAGA